MPERIGQLEMVDAAGGTIGFVTKLVIPGGVAVNGVGSIPGVSDTGGGVNAISYKGASAPSAAEFNFLDGVTSPIQAQFDALGTASTYDVGTSSGDIPALGAGGKLASTLLPAIAITDTFVVASQAAMLALTAETGDVAVRTDLNKSFILAGTNPATLAHWQELLTPTDAVLSVNGQTGVVVLTTSHITEGSNLYYTQGRFDTAFATKSTTNLAEGSNLYYTQARFDTAFAAKSTTNLAEGTNLYYTDERVDDRVAALLLGTTNQITKTYDDALGTLTLSLPQNIHTGASPQFTGLTLTGNLSAAGVSSSLIPSVTDTYDLGSSTKLWRKGWLSELDAVLFAKNTVTLVGGWLIVTKNEGTIPVGQDVGTGDTSIDFGQAMTANDFVLFRAAGSVEYVQVGTLSSGTRYNVTRNLDSTGANAWPAGSVYAVLGNTGNGRIEFNANDTPRISLINQGAIYNAQTELLRVGDLNGGWNYGAETYGFAVGEYAAGKAWLSVDPTNGIRVGLHSVVNGQWDTSGNLALGQVATGSGNAFWNNSNKRFEFRGGTNGTVVSSYIDTSGKFVMADAEVSGTLVVSGSITASAGSVLLDANGLGLDAAVGSLKAIQWSAAGIISGQLQSTLSSGVGMMGVLSRGSTSSTTYLESEVGSTARISLQAVSLSTGHSYVNIQTTLGVFDGLGIGFGGAPSAALHVQGSGILTGSLAVDTSTLFVDATNDRVGVGTASPSTRFHVLADANAATVLTLSNATDGNTAQAGMNITSNGGIFTFGKYAPSKTAYKIISGGDAYLYNDVRGHFAFINDYASGGFKFACGGSSTAHLTLSSAGALRLHAYGAGTLTTDASGNVTASSDERLKTKVGDFTAGLAAVLQLEPISYRWKHEVREGVDYVYHGYTAQNVRQAIPGAVGKNADGTLTVDRAVISAAHTNAIKELNDRVTALEALLNQ